MRAVLCEKHGPPETLVVREVDDLTPSKGQVRIAVEACGVNFPDTLIIDTEVRQFSLVWRIEHRIQRNFLEFDTFWLGPPTEPMRKARAEGRTYVRTPAVVDTKDDAA